MIGAVGTLIEQSILLAPERKAQLRALIPRLTAAQTKTLQQTLCKEYGLLADSFSHLIEEEVRDKKNVKFAKDLDQFLRSSSKDMRKAREVDDRNSESKLLTDIDRQFSS